MTLPKKDENLFFSVFPSSLMMNCCDYIIIIINTYDMIIYTMIKNEIYCLLYFLFMPIPIWVTPLFITVFEISRNFFWHIQTQMRRYSVRWSLRILKGLQTQPIPTVRFLLNRTISWSSNFSVYATSSRVHTKLQIKEHDSPAIP